MSNSKPVYFLENFMRLNKKTGWGTFFLIALSHLAVLTCKVTGSSGNYQSSDGGQVKVWKVAFNADGGNPEPEPNPVMVADGETIGALPKDDPAKNGWTFGGWYRGESQFDPATPVSGDITLRAKWIGAEQAGHYHVTFDGDGGSPATYVKQNVIDGGTVDPLPGVTRTGYTFGGWWTKEDGLGTQFTTSTPVTGALTLHAKWTPVAYTVSYNPNGGTGSMASGTHTYGVSKRLSAISTGTISYGGHTFEGWARSAGSASWDYADNDPVINLTSTQGATVPLYAVWSSASKGGGGTWLGGDWSAAVTGWSEDPVVAGTSDPTSAYPPTVSTASTWVEVVDADIDAFGILTIAVDGTAGTFTISGDNSTGPLVPAASYSLTTDGVRFTGVSGNRRIVVDAASGANPSNPLNIELAGVNISIGNANPLWLTNNANVLLNIVSDSVLTSAGTYRRFAGLRVPDGTKIEITSSTGASLLAQNTGTSQSCGAGIGSNESETAGTIVINGDVIVTAIAAVGSSPGAGIGGGAWGAGGTTVIGGSARVTAIGANGPSSGGPGIGGGMINIGGNARLTATGGIGSAGIGSAWSGNVTTAIGGNARVVATGGSDSAGIGGGGSKPGGTISISGGIVIARTSGASNRAAAIGAGGHAANSFAAGKITISGGFVLARSANPAAPGIGASEGYTGAWDNNDNAVIITGGSVYAANALVSPAPQNASGTAVFPLYVPASLGGGKTISVPQSPVYTAKTIDKSAARFLNTGLFTASGADQFPATAVTGLDGIFPTAISATLWLPAAAYSGITTSPSSGAYVAEVQAVIAPYTDGGANRMMR
jgi:uncharacterized repeat protein (TIGR02543 family)